MDYTIGRHTTRRTLIAMDLYFLSYIFEQHLVYFLDGELVLFLQTFVNFPPLLLALYTAYLISGIFRHCGIYEIMYGIWN